MNENKKIEFLPPFKRFCMTIGELPSSYLETMSYYEMLVWFTKFLKDQVVPVVNNNSEVVTELQKFVEDYFSNLDVQEEINNKLDDMAEQGTLQEIIADYLNSKAVFGFDTVEDMKESTNLIDGSYAKTLGYYAKNDGGMSTYKIREITNDDVVDEASIIALSDNTLIAELIITNDTVNVKQLGATGDGETDDSSYFRKAVGKYKNVQVPIGSYLFGSSVVLTGYDINFYGIPEISPNVLSSERSIIISPENDYAFTIGWGNVNNFSHISFTGYGLDAPTSSVIENCMFQGKTGMRNTRMLQVDKCMFRDMEIGIDGLTDTVVTNCVFNPCSIEAINLTNSNDNRILNNRITWNQLGLLIRNSNFNNISNNIFDRNTTYGIDVEDSSWNIISNNIFERNLTNHIKGKLYYSNINGNEFIAKNSLDDQSGSIVPTTAFNIANFKGCTFNGNSINRSSILFNNYTVAWENNSWSGNSFDYKPLEGDLVKIGELTIQPNSSETLTVAWNTYKYLGASAFDIDIDYIKLYKSPKAVFSGDSSITQIDKDNNTGIHITVSNSSQSNTATWDVYAKLSVINPRHIETTI